MAVAFRAAGTGVSGASPLTPGIPSGTSSGDILIAICASSQFTGSIPSFPGGWTSLGTFASASTFDWAIAYKVAGSSESAPSITFAGAGTFNSAIVYGYSGGQVDVTGSTLTQTSGTSPSIPSITTTAADLVVAIVGHISTITLSSRKIGATNATIDNASGNIGSKGAEFQAWSIQQGASGASGAGTATASGNDEILALLVGLSVAGVVAGPSPGAKARVISAAVNRAGLR